MQPGHEPTQVNLHEHGEHDPTGKALDRPFRRSFAIGYKATRNVEYRRYDDTGRRQMDRQTILADARQLAQAGGNHPPADGALQPAECEQTQHTVFEATAEASRHPEEGQRNGDQKPDKTRKQAMRPFPPENVLEFLQRHALVDLLILGNLAVLVELLHPFGVVERRNDAVNGLPFGYGKARTRHACGTADHDDGNQHDENCIKPETNEATVAVLFR